MSTAKNCSPATARAKAKSSFAMTCNRLSFFLKEKGSLRDIRIDDSFDLKGKPEMTSPVTVTVAEKEKNTTTTVDLLSSMESSQTTVLQTTEKTEESNNHLPQFVTTDSFCKPDGSTDKGVAGEAVAAAEANTGQMTIFYGGEVLVFDCVSAEKARDLMLAASGGSDGDFSGNQINNRMKLDSNSNSTSISASEALGSQAEIVPGVQLNGSDLPIARRASLHRFLAKRKDRSIVRSAPYQLHNPLMASTSSNHKFDLNL